MRGDRGRDCGVVCRIRSGLQPPHSHRSPACSAVLQFLESSVFVTGCFAHLTCLLCVVQGVCQLVHQRGASVRLGGSRAGESYPAVPPVSLLNARLLLRVLGLSIWCEVDLPPSSLVSGWIDP